jgi:hypothetical protein
MSAQPAAGSKVCIICGTNVAKLPRVKDEHGRYMCEGMCEQAARERNRAGAQPAAPKPASAPRPAAPKPVAPPPVVEQDDNMMANLLDDSPAVNVNACPGCGTAMPGGALVCVNCGYNARVGKAAKTKVVRTPVASQMPVPRRRSGGEFGPSFGALALLSIVFFCGVAALGAMNLGLFLLAVIVCGGACLIGYVWSIVSAFRSDNTKYGVYGLLVVIPLVNLISLVFVFWALANNPDKWSRSLYTGAFLSNILLNVIFFTMHQDALAELVPTQP